MSGCLGGGRPQRAVNGPVSGPHPGLRLGDGEWAQLASACRRAAKLVDDGVGMTCFAVALTYDGVVHVGTRI